MSHVLTRYDDTAPVDYMVVSADGEWVRYGDVARLLQEASEAEQDTLINYQVLEVRNGELSTRRSFWAENDADAARLAGLLPPGCVLVHVVEDVKR